MIKDMHRGAWVLVRAHDKVSNYDKLKKQHVREQKRKKKANCLPFTVPVESPADRAGYILFKDNKVVCFYTNDLEKTPSLDILLHSDPEVVTCTQGLASIARWTGEESLHRRTFQVLTIVVAYNTYMNLVDHMDQLQPTSPIKHKEWRVEMTIFTMLLDLAVNNAFALYKK